MYKIYPFYDQNYLPLNDTKYFLAGSGTLPPGTGGMSGIYPVGTRGSHIGIGMVPGTTAGRGSEYTGKSYLYSITRVREHTSWMFTSINSVSLP